MDQLQVWAEGFVSTPWIFLVVYLFATVDGFFPPIPSESLVIAMAALWAATGQPNLAGIVLVATVGAFTGDQITYQVGRMVKIRRLGVLRGARAQAALDWAEQALARRGAAFIIAARYIPVGRVAVNVIAGALHYPRRRFMAVDAVASAMWAVYSSAIGLVAGKVLGDYPLVAVVVGVGGGVIIGVVVDWVLQRFLTSPSQGPQDAADRPRGADSTQTEGDSTVGASTE
ncbi:MAG: DedA family protein [Micrococcales bacterium]|nr:DedA family protein [Micrococcales bacterium]